MDSDDEEWGEDRMLQCIQSCDGLRAAEIIQHVLAAADAFAKGAPQHDDMTLVVARIG
jgi:sigma-B regulation protein RsbU (phosphoserine phosphatase)